MVAVRVTSKTRFVSELQWLRLLEDCTVHDHAGAPVMVRLTVPIGSGCGWHKRGGTALTATPAAPMATTLLRRCEKIGLAIN
jgi:hypothetical protein